ncbi:MAG: phosphoenolpyruvate synthase [Rhodospirillales bacterium CG15_BIG_FIL_POST_REV_8_21_14_020_66_15]|nr:MAG: phosphoenolpyruvate synthase [Rhodospirillales bacterium CG15_BIG_FIL_POST_REV_8_21_14_020_66_15]
MKHVGLQFTHKLSSLPSDTRKQFGGKAASLGDLIRALKDKNIKVPDGFVINTDGYERFMTAGGLASGAGTGAWDADVTAEGLSERRRDEILSAEFPDDLKTEIARAYEDLADACGTPAPLVAVRSSATAEDLPDASFAGQYDSFLFVTGLDAVLDACRKCYASALNERAIAYRLENGYGEWDIRVAVIVQEMVRADMGAAGVAFSIDTESGFPHAVLVSGAWGTGESVVQGMVEPDEFLVHKNRFPATCRILRRHRGAKHVKTTYDPGKRGRKHVCVPTSEAEQAGYCLTDDQAELLADWVARIEDLFGTAVDVEWALDGKTEELYVVQARPETAHRRSAGSGRLRTFQVGEHGPLLAKGVGVGSGFATGRARRLYSPGDDGDFRDGDILVTANTDPNWLPIMRKAGAIITDHGGRTSHAAIVSRELGLPAVTGTGDGTSCVADGTIVTVVSGADRNGFVYEGAADILSREIDVSAIEETRTKVMLNLANPETAFEWWRLPADGVGLARMEFIISNHIRVHPLALAHFDQLEDADAARQIAELTSGYADKAEFFIDRLAEGLAAIAAVAWPHPAIVRTSDFKTNEYAGLLGGRMFEPAEENPMIGWRGASRYIDPAYAEGFRLECAALRKARSEYGFDNIKVMLPFCRTVREAEMTLDRMALQGLKRGAEKLDILMMCEVPSNVFRIDEFAALFDGFSIGSNDLTQLVLGVDRDSERLQNTFNEMDPAVQWAIRHVIERAHLAGRKVGICGEGAGDDGVFASFLIDAEIDSISAAPHAFPEVKRRVLEAERIRPRFGEFRKAI